MVRFAERKGRVAARVAQAVLGLAFLGLLAPLLHLRALALGPSASTAGTQIRNQQPVETSAQSSPASQVRPAAHPPPPLPTLLCGGPAGVPSLTASLAASTAALQQSVGDAFKPYAPGFTLQDVEATADALQIGQDKLDVRFWLEVRNKTIILPRHKDQRCPPPCNNRFTSLVARLEWAMAAGQLSIPEGLPLLLNIDDPSLCSVTNGTSPCRSPLLSILKKSEDLDVAVPSFVTPFEPVFLPWQEKRDLAFFRGSATCSLPTLNGTAPTGGSACVRYHMAQLSWDHPDLLNATILEDVTQFGGPRHLPGPQATMEEHAAYKYVLDFDGIVASFRMKALLALNSLVLKQASPQLQWYYLPLRPCEHYLPFWVRHEDDVLELVAQLRGRPENDEVAQRIAANSQAFALAHLTDDGAFRHWQRVVDTYARLYKA